MKTTTTKVSLLAIALLAIGCNEQVAPELKDSNSAGTGGSTVVVPPTEYYFRVVDKSLPMLNYKLHRTGEGRAEAKCEIKGTTQFSNLLYTGESALGHDSKINDITCFFEAEELALYHSGMDFAFEASANTCEYVSYTPFSYYFKMPGTSSSSITQVECTTDETTDAHAATAGAPSDASGTIGCGQSVDTSISLASERVAFNNFEDNQDLCRYDYTKEGGPNCDEGIINLTKLEVTYVNATASSPASLKYTSTNSRIPCGGKAANCTAGPIKFETSLVGTYGSVITRTEINTPFTETKQFPGLIEDQKDSNRDYVNFRRTLASTEINFINDLDAGYVGSFAYPSSNKAYEPAIMDRYSNNKRMNGSALADPAALTAQSKIHGYTAKPLAVEPFVGVDASHRTSPFYTFHCLDKAMDIKARIRMVVRDWDREFPMASNLELIADMHLGANARQDVPDDVEIPGDQDPYNYYNDFYDWDDLLFMQRTSGSYNSALTIWQPYLGFFKRGNFPQGGFE